MQAPADGSRAELELHVFRTGRISLVIGLAFLAGAILLGGSGVLS